MIMINESPDRGAQVDTVRSYFRTLGPQRVVLAADIPGFLELSSDKRARRVEKVIVHLLRSGRARIEVSGVETAGRLVPLNVLDKIVWAIERAEAEAANRETP